MRIQKYFVSLEQTSYNSATKTYTLDVSNDDLKNPQSVTFDKITIGNGTKRPFTLVRSWEIANRAQVRPVSNTSFGPVVATVHSDDTFETSFSTTSNGPVVSGSDESITAIGSDLLAWFDMHPSRVLDTNFATASTAGDPVSYLYNRAPAPATLLYVSQYGNEFQLANVGEAKGITRNGSWQSLADSSTPTGALTEQFTVHSLVVMPPVMGTFSYLFDLGPLLKTFTWTGGAIGYKNAAGNNATVPVALIPLRAYIISIEREGIDTSGDGNIDDYQFNWTIEDLVAESTVSHTTPRGNTHPGSEQVWRLGHASTNNSKWLKMSHKIVENDDELCIQHNNKVLKNSFISDYPIGYVMKNENNNIVGFMGTIYSRRNFNNQEYIYCNIHSWIVDETYRINSFLLLMPLINQKITLTAFTPVKSLVGLLEKFNFTFSFVIWKHFGAGEGN